jgi:hypothetical protein
MIIVISLLIVLVTFIFISRRSIKSNGYEQKLIIKEELSLGGREEHENYLFTRIRIDVDNEQNLYVLDERLRNIRTFNKEGQFVRFIGRTGQGPGEYQRPAIFIQITSKKEVVIYDRGTGNFIFYYPDGDYLKRINAGKIPILFNARIDNEGNFICSYSSAPPSLELRKFNSEFQVLKTFFYQQEDIGYGHDLEIEQPKLYFAVTQNDYLIWGYSEKYELHVIDAKGKAMRTITKQHKPVKFSARDKEEYKKIYERMIERGAILKYPSHFPAFADISVDDNNRIFIMTFKRNREGNHYYDVFDFEGHYLMRILLPFKPVIWKNNKVYAINRTEDGYSIIKRYAVEWKP